MARMQSRFMAWWLAGAIPLVTSCAHPGSLVVLGPVGPPPSQVAGSTETGYLKVYSATEDRVDGDLHYHPHTAYRIDSPDGRLVKKISNAIGSHDEDPVLVQLPPAAYTVLARAELYGMVKVKVVIAPGAVTTVRLDSTANWPLASDHAAHVVRLPNGRIVGWRATTMAQATE